MLWLDGNNCGVLCGVSSTAHQCRASVTSSTPLHRMRGREVLLNFWQSGSAPCIKELERLERLHKRAGKRAPLAGIDWLEPGSNTFHSRYPIRRIGRLKTRWPMDWTLNDTIATTEDTEDTEGQTCSILCVLHVLCGR